MYYIKGFSAVGFFAIASLLTIITGIISYKYIVPYVLEIAVDQVDFLNCV